MYVPRRSFFIFSKVKRRRVGGLTLCVGFWWEMGGSWLFTRFRKFPLRYCFDLCEVVQIAVVKKWQSERWNKLTSKSTQRVPLMPRLSPRPSRVDRPSVSITEKKKKCPINRTYKQTAGPGMNGAFITSLHFSGKRVERISETDLVGRRGHRLQQGCSLAKQYILYCVCGDRAKRSPDRSAHRLSHRYYLISVVCPSAKRAGRPSRF